MWLILFLFFAPVNVINEALQSTGYTMRISLARLDAISRCETFLGLWDKNANVRLSRDALNDLVTRLAEKEGMFFLMNRKLNNNVVDFT